MTGRTSTICFLFVALCLANTTLAAEAARYECQLVLLRIPAEGARFEARQAGLTGGALLASGSFSIAWGDSKLTSDGEHLSWNDVELPLPPGASSPGSSVKLLGTPRITTTLGHSGRAQVKAGTQEAVQYFEREDDGRFALRVTLVAPSLDLSFTLDKSATPGALRLAWGFELVKIGERKKLSGVSLDVGSPAINKAYGKAEGELELGRWSMLACGENTGLVIFLRVVPAR